MNKQSENSDREDRPNPVTAGWLRNILGRVVSGELSIEKAMGELEILPYEDLNFARIDHHRSLRTGFPEVIYGRGKTVEQVVSIAEKIALRSGKILVTQAPDGAFNTLKDILPDAVYHPLSRTITVNRYPDANPKEGIVVVSGGTADIPVAEEAVVTAELMDNQVETIYDAGVAGLHRLLDKLDRLRKARVIIAVAGMEGALPGVICGLVEAPVIAVPTSVGYGANFKGLAPLLAMLNSCAPGVAVVNIDNGFGAGYIAGLINRKMEE